MDARQGLLVLTLSPPTDTIYRWKKTNNTGVWTFIVGWRYAGFYRCADGRVGRCTKFYYGVSAPHPHPRHETFLNLTHAHTHPLTSTHSHSRIHTMSHAHASPSHMETYTRAHTYFHPPTPSLAQAKAPPVCRQDRQGRGVHVPGTEVSRVHSLGNGLRRTGIPAPVCASS